MESSVILDAISFNIVGVGDMRLGASYCTKNLLQYLTQLDDVIVCNQEGEEVFPGDDGSFHLDPKSSYFLLDETDLDLVGSDDEEDPINVGEETRKKQYERMVKLQQRIPAMEAARKAFIKENYKPKYPYLFDLESNKNLIMDPKFAEVISNVKKVINGQNSLPSDVKNEVFKIVKDESKTGIYSYVLFTQKFCSDLIEEVEHFQISGLPLLRPNSMNKYGLVLN